MNILFLGYWNADDPLTSATILPHLKILKKFDKINNVVFVNAQREEVSQERLKEIEDIGVKYYPMYSRNLSFNLINKISDFILFPRFIIQLTTKHDIQLIIARGAPAGGLAYLVWKKSRIPFVVESFEPHAAYMLVTKTWKRYDPRYISQAYLEKKQKQHATALITVSENYRMALKAEGIEENRLFTVPCSVDQEKFFPDAQLRKIAREELKIPEEATVGVYAGKFGGLYYEDEAFELFQKAFSHYKEFYLLLLSAQDKRWVQTKIKVFNLPTGYCRHLFVGHELVNQYLNAADFAFALYKETAVAKFLSPVKVGEYWAAGIPIVLTDKVGDEHLLIKKLGGGVLFKKKNVEDVFSNIDKIIAASLKDFYVKLSTKYRAEKKVEDVYKLVLRSLNNPL